MIEQTMGNRKRIYNKWVKLVDRLKLKEEYLRINKVFEEINKVIKSVSDVIFVENRIAKMK